MGIRLDWEVESQRGRTEVGEDPRAVEARRRRTRRIRNTLLVTLGLFLVIAAVIGYRLFTVGQQVREALKATIAAETLALRIGNRDAYLMAQSDMGGWQQVQAQTFQRYQEEAARVDADGQIVQMDISADQARVTLREVVDGELYHVMWFYKRDARGWKHVAPDLRFWGEPKTQRSAYFTFEYYSEDQTLVNALAEQLDGWWKTTCDLAQCNDTTSSVDIKIEPVWLAKDGAQYDDNALIIPSPLLGRFPANGKPDPQLTAELADLIAYRWAEHLVGKEEVRPYSELDWLRSEVHWWLRHSFDPTQPPAPLLDPLVQTYGKEIVPPLVSQIRESYPAVLALQGLTGVQAADLDVGWQLYLTYRVRGEMALLRVDNESDAIVLYRDPERPIVSDAVFIYSFEHWDVDSIQVVGLRRYGDLVWAEVESTFRTIEYPGRGFTAHLPFRLLRGRWVHTFAYEDDWGMDKEERGAHVVLRYRDLDASMVEGLLSSLEQTYQQVDVDVEGLAEARVIVEIVGYTSQSGPLPPCLVEQQPSSPEEIYVPVCSPYSYPYLLTENTREGFHWLATYWLIARLIEPYFSSFSSEHPLLLALQGFEARRCGLEPDMSWRPQIERQPPEFLGDLWLDNSDCNQCQVVAAEVLLDLLTERYGEEETARLIPNLSQAGSMDDWLYISLGIHTVDIEAEWRERVKAALSASP